MHHYSLYKLSSNSRIVSRRDQFCHDDNAAVAIAVGMHRYVEIWCDRRIVTRVDRHGQVVSGQPSIFSPAMGLRE
jgi:hypothetical protein